MIFFDEFYFHRKRGLGMWERLGHPLDTLTVLSCYVFMSFNEPSVLNTKIYVGLCLFSCLFITKDEFVHTAQCEARENWLHAVLFVIHPITFLSAWIIWNQNLNFKFLQIQSFVTLFFMFYQILYWSPLWQKKS
ncbi:MAG: hypothetical protein H7235_09100 [Bdellovibrionaceae bacterium]|nr:hypothetical protein [Pseudobdellovibrionaceae bacterium]